MIKPHGSKTLMPLYVADDARRAALEQEAESLPSLLISSAAAASAVMLGSGYFNPLNGFMSLNDALKVANEMQIASGLFWPVPILNIVPADRISADIS
ncbi:MAG: sulfate adenylyltransferase, partial [Calditrichaeota bacterium]|nr:sulfate adenylyltransferase [Calditrichota bacterium]